MMFPGEGSVPASSDMIPSTALSWGIPVLEHLRCIVDLHCISAQNLAVDNHIVCTTPTLYYHYPPHYT